MMEKQPPSIFNDVIGPVMRGPSSSHTAASVRIGRLVRQYLSGPPVSCSVDFAPDGSLASTYHGQGTDIGLAGGLLNMELTDPRLVGSLEIARQNGLVLSFNIIDFPTAHPNTYRITAAGEDGIVVKFIFISTGGGMIELQKIDDIPLLIAGDYYETLFFFRDIDQALLKKYQTELARLIANSDYCTSSLAGSEGLVNLKTTSRLTAGVINAGQKYAHLKRVAQLDPILPIRSRKNITVPFTCAAAALELAEAEQLEIWQLALRYESERGGVSAEKVYSMAAKLVKIMKTSVREGLAGTEYEDRILGPQAIKIERARGKLIGGELFSQIIAYTTAVMEVKSAMGVIVAAPTAGSCGVLPGALLATAEDMGFSDDAVAKVLLAAGIIGVLIAGRSTFAAEECGCQAECGSASGMAAAGLVQMMGGTVREAFDAASIALQNIFGMVCDPVADRVEVPCLGKNVLAGLNAVGAANMALAGYDKVIPLDETIAALHQVGKMLPPELRCTGAAGLSVTKTAQQIHHRLK